MEVCINGSVSGWFHYYKLKKNKYGSGIGISQTCRDNTEINKGVKLMKGILTALVGC